MTLTFISASRALDNLAHNLAIAGALCEAFELGQREVQTWAAWREGEADPEPWIPGCGRSVP